VGVCHYLAFRKVSAFQEYIYQACEAEVGGLITGKLTRALAIIINKGNLMERNNVFFCWGGSLSKKMAELFIVFIPKIIPNVRPFISSEIHKGKSWLNEILKGLAQCNFGILFMTKDNVDNLWINFEAGAVIKGSNTNNVSPILINLKQNKLKPPLSLFQSTSLTGPELFRLIKDINKSLGHKQLKSDKLKLNWHEHSTAFLKEIKQTIKKANSKTRNKPRIKSLKEINNPGVMKLMQNTYDKPIQNVQTIQPSPRILAQISAVPSGKLSIQSIFPGIWNNTYTSPGQQPISEQIEIKDGDKYFVNGQHRFNIKDFNTNSDGTVITFAKQWANNYGIPIINTIKRINWGHYEGTENNGSKVIYTRIS
jgi:hypothetical protein